MQVAIAILFALIFIAAAVFVLRPTRPSRSSTDTASGGGGGGVNKSGTSDQQ